MKNQTNQFKKALMVIAFFALNIFAFSNLSAQTYFTPGQPYVFKSIINSTQTRVITIVFDANANATLSSQLVPIDPNNDKQASYGFAPHNEASYDVATNTFNISQNINKYIVISFTDPTQTQAVPLGGLTYSCSCRTPMKDPPATPAPDCTPSAQKSGDDCYCMACTVNASCSECGPLTTSRGVILNNMNVSLVIKVNSLNYQ